MTSRPGALIGFSGRPGAGETRLARLAASHLAWTYVRADGVERAVRSADPGRDVGAVCRLAIQALAEANPTLGTPVVAARVNPPAPSGGPTVYVDLRSLVRQVRRLSPSSRIRISARS